LSTAHARARRAPAAHGARAAAPFAAAAGEALDSVAMIARLFDELAAAPAAMGVTELARALGESKARVHRNLQSLKRFGLIDQESASEKYRLGWKLFQLGERAGQQFDLRERALPALKRLRDLTGQSALLAVPVNGAAQVIATADNEANVSITVKPGNRPLPHCSTQGRIALAWAEATVRDRVLALPLEALTPRSTTDAARLRRRLDLVRARLWETAADESMLGINVLGAPVLRGDGALVGIVSIIGSVQHVPAQPQPEQLAAVQGCAAALSRDFGANDYRAQGVAIPPAFERDAGSGSA
jgi:DNA-binding IclR family transcriptional regulator